MSAKQNTAPARAPAAMDPLELACLHFTRQSKQCIEVPEWGPEGRPLKVYYDGLSLRDRFHLDQWTAGKGSRLMPLVLIKHAKHADGSAIFKDDAETLAKLETEVDATVLSRVAGQIMQTSDQVDLGNS